MNMKGKTYDELRAQAGPQKVEVKPSHQRNERDRLAGDTLLGGQPSNPRRKLLRGRRAAATMPPPWDETSRSEYLADPDLWIAGMDEIELLGLLRAFQARGLDPNPYPDESLEWLAEQITAALSASDSSIYSDEDAFVRSDSIGVVNPMCMFDETGVPANHKSRSTQIHGYPWHVISDLSDAGVGIVRHVNNADLGWVKLVHNDKPWDPYLADVDDTIPEPAAIRPWLLDLEDEDDEPSFWRFRKFTLLTIICALCEMKVIPILLDDGAGWLDDDDDTSLAKPGKPSHQSKFWKISEWGWRAFYHDASLVGFTPGRGEAEYQQSFFNVVVADDASEYMKECARRKTLALAEYGKAVGIYLAALDEAFHEELGQGLETVVGFLEVGNEVDTIWTSKLFTASDKALAAREVARMMLTVAAGARLGYEQAAAGTRSFPFTYRFPALLGWVRPEDSEADWTDRVDWIVTALDAGVGEELSRLQRSVVGMQFVGGDEHEAWTATCEAAGVPWPTPVEDQGLLAFGAGGLFVEVDFHFWHHCDGKPFGPKYVTDAHMGEDIATLHTGLSELSEAYPSLDWALGGVAFMAERGVEEDAATLEEDDSQSPYSKDASPLMQAGMLVRRLLYAKAKGATRVLWHTFMATLDDRAGAFDTQYTANGLRNDLYDLEHSQHGAYPSSNETFTWYEHAWRRPSWYALRRLAWLLSRTSGSRVLVDQDSAVVIRCHAAATTPFRVPVTGSVPLTDQAMTETYTQAWVFWLDQEVVGGYLEVTLQLQSGSGSFQPLSLVPSVQRQARRWPAGLDTPNTYPEGGEPDWNQDDGGWSAATTSVTRHSDGLGTELVIRMEPASPEDNPVPFCVFTHKALLIEARVVSSASDEMGSTGTQKHSANRLGTEDDTSKGG